jgi:hypothetical protein
LAGFFAISNFSPKISYLPVGPPTDKTTTSRVPLHRHFFGSLDGTELNSGNSTVRDIGHCAEEKSAKSCAMASALMIGTGIAVTAFLVSHCEIASFVSFPLGLQLLADGDAATGPCWACRMAPVARRRRRARKSFLQGRLRTPHEQERGCPHPRT